MKFAVALLALSAQSSEEIVASLIERTNELDSFHVVYEVETEEDGETEVGAIEFVFQSPGVGRLRISTPDRMADTWVVDGVMYLHAAGAWKRAPIPGPSAARLALEELFPTEDAALDSGLLFVLLPKAATASRKAALDFSVSTVDGPRAGLLDWLLRMRSEAVVEEDGSLAWIGDDFRMDVSGEHGFPTALEMRTSDKEISLRLREARFDEELEESLVTVPSRGRRADVDEEMAKGLVALYSAARARQVAFRRVAGQVEGGRRELDGRTRGDWEDFLSELHGERVRGMVEVRTRDVESKIDAMAERVRGELTKDPSPENRSRVEAEVARQRGRLQGSLEEDLGRYLERLPGLEESASAAVEELAEWERAFIGRLFDEWLVSPLMTAFDQRVGAALDS